MNIRKDLYGKMEDGIKIDLYTLTNDHGLKAGIITYGGIVILLEAPDRNGKPVDIALGFDNLEGYVKENSPHFGGIIGRYANRIAQGRFTLNGVDYRLTVNDSPNQLHGGFKGFDAVVWDAEPVETTDTVGVKLRYLSRDGGEGYPGNLSCMVVYTLTNNDAFQIAYEATTDQPTPVNLTNHTYFNLAGQDAGSILDHELIIMAESYTPVDKHMIPTGEILPVRNTPLDFSQPKKIGERIDALNMGYDHNFVLSSGEGLLALAARVAEPGSGRVMEIMTTEPGVQFYTGNFLDGSIMGKGKRYRQHEGFCLEVQHFPDSPNKPHFPSTVLEPGEKYTQLTVHRFFTQ